MEAITFRGASGLCDGSTPCAPRDLSTDRLRIGIDESFCAEGPCHLRTAHILPEQVWLGTWRAMSCVSPSNVAQCKCHQVAS